MAYLRTCFVQVLTINASSTLIHHTIALHEHNAYQTSLRPLKDKGGRRGRSQTEHPHQRTTQGAHHNQTSLRPLKDKGGRRGRSQTEHPRKQTREGLKTYDSSVYENNFVLQGYMFAHNFHNAKQVECFSWKSYRLHNGYEIPL